MTPLSWGGLSSSHPEVLFLAISSGRLFRTPDVCAGLSPGGPKRNRIVRFIPSVSRNHVKVTSCVCTERSLTAPFVSRLTPAPQGGLRGDASVCQDARRLFSRVGIHALLPCSGSICLTPCFHRSNPCLSPSAPPAVTGLAASTGSFFLFEFFCLFIFC